MRFPFSPRSLLDTHPTSRWIDLKKLYLNGLSYGYSSSLIVSPESAQPFSSSLVRLDLHAVYIDSWWPDIHSLRTLTLTHVTFGVEESEEDEDEDETDLYITARQFFQSYPKLRAIAFNGLDSINSDALAFLPIFSLRYLYLGKCSYSRSKCPCEPISSGTNDLEFVDCLARHFRSKIQHLVLDPSESSSVRLAQLLSSRTDRSFPPYLAKLNSIRIAAPPTPMESTRYCPEASVSDEEDDSQSLVPVEPRSSWKVDQEKRVRSMLDKAGLEGVEIKWWRDGEKEACTAWDPDEVRWQENFVGDVAK